MSVNPNQLVDVLRKLGYRVSGDEFGCQVVVPYPDGESGRWVIWNYGEECPEMEALLRSEVRKVAPGSYVRPWLCDPGYALLLLDKDGSHARFKAPRELDVDTETEAWAAALIALNGSGLLGESNT